MFGKRGAGNQLTKDSLGEDEGESQPVFKAASNEVMAKRKIFAPKRKKPSSIGASSGLLGTSTSNVFSSLSKPETSAPSTGGLYPSLSLAKLGSAKESESKVSLDVLDTASMIKALNENFMAALTLTSKKAPLGDYTEYCEKYIKYFKQIKEGSVKLDSVKGADLDKSIKASPEKEAPKAIESDDKPKGPTFTFQPKAGAKPTLTFKFGAKESKPVLGPSFTIPTAAKTDKVDTPFTWGKKPIVALEKKDTEDKSESKEEAKEGSKKEESSVPSKPTFNFSFGSKDTKDSKESEKPSTPKFSFGSSSTTDSPKPVFSFGKSTTDSASKPVFSFSASKSSDSPKPFSFGKSESTNGEDKKDSPKPAFTFLKPTDSSDKPQDKEGAKPAFSFSFKKPEELKEGESKPLFPKFPTTGASTEKKDGEAKPFTFGKPGAFSFGSNGSTAFGKSTTSFNFSTTKPTDNEKKPEASEESAPSDSVPKASTSEPVDEVFAGEENENILYNKKAKLLQIEDNNYVTKGLGFLRILQHKDTKKCRMVLRSEGTNNVLFNQYILKKLKCDIAGKNTLRVPSVVDGKMETYFIRVKNGDELLEEINKNALD